MFNSVLKRVFGGTLLTAFLALSLAACGDDLTAPGGTGDFAVTLSQTDGSSTAAALTESSPRFSQVELSSVSSILVTVDAVQVHRVDDEENGENGENGEPGGWIDLDVSETQIDLIGDLSGDASFTVAEGDLPAGDYDGVRFFFSEATISFDPPAQHPSSGEEIAEADLVIPSGAQTGIKVPGASFTVEGEGTTEFSVMFDADTSVQNVNITGTGQVMMAPVLVGENDVEEEGTSES
jgi:hypothetical protein